MIIECGRPNGSGLVFCESFRSRQLIQSRGGALVGCAVGDGGIKPTAASSRVTFAGTENVGINATQMTIALRFRTPSVTWASNRPVISKAEDAMVSFAWSCELANTSWLVIYMGTVSNYIYVPNIAVSTEYAMYVSYNGLLAAASRGVAYIGGSVAPGSAISGTLPTSILSTARPITALNRDTGASRAPPTDFVLRNARIYNTAWSAEEVLDDYQNDTYAEVFGGGP